MSRGPSTAPATGLSSPLRAALARGTSFFALWVVLMPSAKPADLAVGALATVAVTWVSLRILPPAAGCLRFGALLALMPHFFWQSVPAGIDVARRALDPRLPLNPGFVEERLLARVLVAGQGHA